MLDRFDKNHSPDIMIEYVESTKQIKTAIKNNNLSEISDIMNGKFGKVMLYNQAVLKYACDNQRYDALRVLVNKGYDVNKQEDGHEMPLLYKAAEQGLNELVDALIENGADVNCACGIDQKTPLMIACENGHIDVVQLLINGKANVDLFSKSKVIELTGQQKEFVLRVAPNHNFKDGQIMPGKNALMFAAKSKNPLGCVKLLLEAGADVHASEAGRDFMMFIEEERVNIVKSYFEDIQLQSYIEDNSHLSDQLVF